MPPLSLPYASPMPPLSLPYVSHRQAARCDRRLAARLRAGGHGREAGQPLTVTLALTPTPTPTPYPYPLPPTPYPYPLPSPLPLPLPQVKVYEIQDQCSALVPLRTI